MDIIIPVPYTVVAGAAEPGPGETAWNAATNYTLGTLAYLPSTHRVYKNLIAGVDAASPHIEALKAVDDPTKRWKEWKPTNRYAMFDQLVGSFTEHASPLVATIQLAEFADSLWLDVDACSTVRVEVLDGATVVYDVTKDMLDADDIVDWYEYYFAPIVAKRQVTLTDLPPITNAQVRMTFTGGGTVRVGSCVPGRLRVIGDTEMSPSIGLITYSQKNVDSETNITRIDRGAISRRVNLSAICATGSVDTIVLTLTELEDTPIVWIGTRGKLESLTVYGFAKDWEVVVRFATRSFLSARLESLA